MGRHAASNGDEPDRTPVAGGRRRTDVPAGPPPDLSDHPTTPGRSRAERRREGLLASVEDPGRRPRTGDTGRVAAGPVEERTAQPDTVATGRPASGRRRAPESGAPARSAGPATTDAPYRPGPPATPWEQPASPQPASPQPSRPQAARPPARPQPRAAAPEDPSAPRTRESGARPPAATAAPAAPAPSAPPTSTYAIANPETRLTAVPARAEEGRSSGPSAASGAAVAVTVVPAASPGSAVPATVHSVVLRPEDVATAALAGPSRRSEEEGRREEPRRREAEEARREEARRRETEERSRRERERAEQARRSAPPAAGARDRPSSDRPQSDRPSSDRPSSDRPSSDRPASRGGDRRHGPSGPPTGPSRAADRAERAAADAVRRRAEKEAERGAASGRGRTGPVLAAVVLVALAVLGVWSYTSPATRETAATSAADPTASAAPASSGVDPVTAPIPTLDVPTPSVDAAPATPVRVPVTVLNETSVSGLAKRVQQALTTGGWPSGATGGYKGGDIATTTVFFPAGNETARQAALQLVDQFPQLTGPAELFFDVPAGSSPDGIVVVTTGNWQP